MNKASGILLAFLMACGGNGPLTISTRPLEVEKTAEFSGIGLIGYQPLTFRAEHKNGEEIRGALCELTGSGFNLTFLTPAIIMVPNFGERNQNLATYCRFESQTVTQIQTSKKRTGISLSGIATGVGGIAAGAVGELLVGTVTDAIATKPTSDYGYTDTTIIFDEKEE